MIQQNDFSYQSTDLQYGLSMEGSGRSSTAQKIFPDDMTGKSVLDVGCRFGYFCFEALRRGADRVVGIDVHPESLRKARMVADSLGVKPDFELIDIEADPIDGAYDYVLCLNVLHHMKNPIAALDKLISVTRERLVLEVAGLGQHDRKKVGVSRIEAFLLNRAPSILVSRNRTDDPYGDQKFFITSSALEHLLIYQRSMFARVDTFLSDRKNRFISIAHKRRIGRLIVVAGPTSSGKSTLIKKLVNSEAPEVAQRLGIDGGGGWSTISANRLITLTEPSVDQLIFHYDFLRPHLRGAKVHKRDESLDLLDTAEHVTFLTIWCPPEVLRKQLEQSELAPKKKLGIFYGSNRHLKIHEEYKDPAKVCGHYRNWFEYTRSKPGEHIIVSFEDGVRFYSVEGWEDLAREHEDKD